MKKKLKKTKSNANNDEKIGVLVNHLLKSDFVNELPPEDVGAMIQDLSDSSAEDVMLKGIKTSFKISKNLAKQVYTMSLFMKDMRTMLGDLCADDEDDKLSQKNYMKVSKKMGSKKASQFFTLVFRDLGDFLEEMNQEADLLEGVLSSIGLFSSASAKELDERLEKSQMQLVDVDSLGRMNLNKRKVDKDVKN